MRAIGMSGKQLHRMVIAEASTYTVCGCLRGLFFRPALAQIYFPRYDCLTLGIAMAASVGHTCRDCLHRCFGRVPVCEGAGEENQSTGYS